jgi:hypothetical protein
MKRMTLLLALITALFSPGGYAYTSYGVFGVSCGQWLENRPLNNRRATQTEEWVLGFISGIGYGGLKMGSSEHNSMFLWIDNYCKENPLDNLSTATKALVEELVRKAK